MKCQILFCGENKKNITNMSSAELAKRVVKVKTISSICAYKNILFISPLAYKIILLDYATAAVYPFRRYYYVCHFAPSELLHTFRSNE